jgi:hypothetical protein
MIADRMVAIVIDSSLVVQYGISAHHHGCCEFESRSDRGVEHYVIKLVSDFRQVGGFLRVLWFPPPISGDMH